MRSFLALVTLLPLATLAACELSVIGTLRISDLNDASSPDVGAPVLDSGGNAIDSSVASDTGANADSGTNTDTSVDPPEPLGDYGVGKGQTDYMAAANNRNINQFAVLGANVTANTAAFDIKQPINGDNTWSDLSKFVAGAIVMIWMPVTTDNSAATATALRYFGTGTPTAIELKNIVGSPGIFEFRRVRTVAGAGATLTLTLDGGLSNSYDAKTTQVILIPEFKDVTLSAANVLVAKTYRNGVGGFVGFFASGAVNLGANKNDVVSAAGAGFEGAPTAIVVGSLCPWTATMVNGEGAQADGYALRGGNFWGERSYWPSKAGAIGMVANLGGSSNSANGGGGGSCGDAGGGGGSHAVGGGSGGRAYNAAASDGPSGAGRGGQAIVYKLNAPAGERRLMMGGGGGAGNANDVPAGNAACAGGGAGGGVIWIQSASVLGKGILNANGALAADCTTGNGGSGGGAGGTVVLRARTNITCGDMLVNGGDGADADGGHGPGGGGSAGRAWIGPSASPPACIAKFTAGLAGKASGSKRGAEDAETSNTAASFETSPALP